MYPCEECKGGYFESFELHTDEDTYVNVSLKVGYKATVEIGNVTLENIRHVNIKIERVSV